MPYRIGISIALVLSLTLPGCSNNTNPPVTSPSVPATCSSKSPGSLAVFKDPFHAKPQCSFRVATSATAYIYATGLVPADYYVVYVQAQGARPSCVFMAPSGKDRIQPGTAPCDLKKANVTGNQAPNGTVSVSWALGALTKPGTYAISLYDQSVNVESALLATVEVTVQ